MGKIKFTENVVKRNAEYAECREQNIRYREAITNAYRELGYITILQPDMDTERKLNKARNILGFALEGEE